MNIIATLKATRKEILRLRKLYRTTDSRKEATEAQTKERELIENLQASCPHTTTICSNSEYKGSWSYSYDHEDSHPEGRVCLFCGTSETAYNEDFKILTTEPIARFERGDTSWNKDPLDYDFSRLVEWCDPSRFNNAYFYFGKQFHARAEERRKKEEEARRCKHCGCLPHVPTPSLSEMAKNSPLFKQRPRTELKPI